MARIEQRAVDAGIEVEEEAIAHQLGGGRTGQAAIEGEISVIAVENQVVGAVEAAREAGQIGGDG